MKIRRGDTVLVIAGDDASTTARKVLSVVAGGKKVLVEGVNRVYKHVKRGHPRSPQGGRLSKEMPITFQMCCFTVIRAVEAYVLGIATQLMVAKNDVARFATAGLAASAPLRLITPSRNSGQRMRSVYGLSKIRLPRQSLSNSFSIRQRSFNRLSK